MIRIRELAFRYPGSRFQLEIDELELKPGSKTAFVGASGIGKTTLLNLISGLLVPDRGRISVDGIHVSELKELQRRRFRSRQIGFVTQELDLLPYLTAWENLLLPYYVSPALQLDAAVKSRAQSLASSLGITKVLKHKPQELSQGERQRVAIGRALVTEPAVLLGDEPTGNLDPDRSEIILDQLFTEVRKRQATLLMVTHDHALLGRFDRVVNMENLIRSQVDA